jgi:quinoprotein glucose dehydrogenase
VKVQRGVGLGCVWVAGACGGEISPLPTAGGTVEWARYAADARGTRYSPGSAVHRGNVRRLRVAWKVRVGDFPAAAFDLNAARAGSSPEYGTPRIADLRFESTPIMQDGTLYVSTPLNRVLALDPVSGATRWTFDPRLDHARRYPEGFTSRGIAIWRDSLGAANAPCNTRIFLATIDARLFALDASRGVPCEGFGEDGTLHLHRGASVVGKDASPTEIAVTSPPAVVGNVVVVGSALRKSHGPDAASGVVRAFDTRTGALRWSFDAIPRRPTDAAWGAWRPDDARSTTGGNVWSLISADAERDLVFLPTASAAPDFYGGDRSGRNDFANSVVALRASTGAVVWSCQVVHHDLWDYDVAAQPLLATIRRAGRDVPAVIVGTKTGMIFLLQRETGVPLLPVQERAVPPSDVPRESAWPTQPFSVRPLPLLGTRLTADSAFGVDSAERAYCRDAVRALHNEGIFTPPSFRGTLEWPGFWGGINWDGMAWDPVRQRLLITVKRVAMVARLHRRGDPDARSNLEVGREYLPQTGTPYGATRMPLIAPSGTPCTPPPWASIVAVDFSESDAAVRWSRPLGTVPWLSRFRGYRDWGSIAFGGPLVTAGGLVFVAASQDNMIRAFDVEDGSQLWEYQLPAGGQAAPMTYVLNGQQFIVIAAGGRAGIGSPGDWIVAFALPGTGQERK